MMNELFKLEPNRVKPTARLIEDLELDSLDAIDLAVMVEETKGFAFDEETLRRMRTVEDVIVALETLIDSSDAQPSRSSSES